MTISMCHFKNSGLLLFIFLFSNAMSIYLHVRKMENLEKTQTLRRVQQHSSVSVGCGLFNPVNVHALVCARSENPDRQSHSSSTVLFFPGLHENLKDVSPHSG